MAGLIDSLRKQRFNEGDSMIASAAMHPAEAAKRLKDWLENQINTGMGVSQYDERTGFSYAPLERDQHEAAFNLAGLMETGSMPFAPKSAGGTLGTFIGPKAANWDAKAAAEAAKMLDEGMNPTEVWRMKLMGRMPDKSMFSEIPDNEAFYRGSMGANSAYANDVYIHPELYKNYPTLENMRVRETPGGGGSYDPSSWEFTIGTGKDASSTMAHEGQHAIQDIEGWARGGSPENAYIERNLTDLTPLVDPKKIQKSGRTTATDGPILIVNEDGQLQITDGNHRYAEALARGDKTVKTLFDPSFFEGYKGNFDQAIIDAPKENYRRLTGEAQARATQDRLNMNMLQRRSNYPLEGGALGGIPLDQLINRYGGIGPQQGGLLSLLKQQK